MSIIDSISEPLPPSSITEMARSLLDSPTASLQRFESHEGENLDLFLSNFELTLSKFSYTDYDKFLLLKQQVYGKASYLIDSLEPDKLLFYWCKAFIISSICWDWCSEIYCIERINWNESWLQWSTFWIC